jgi:hypothetical protein
VRGPGELLTILAVVTTVTVIVAAFAVALLGNQVSPTGPVPPEGPILEFLPPEVKYVGPWVWYNFTYVFSSVSGYVTN